MVGRVRVPAFTHALRLAGLLELVLRGDKDTCTKETLLYRPVDI
jgi:hypothetical protein